ncbi:hypothetical protein [Glycomyces tenuis]|uniref:hypothetical protein n=1 Tax=Glycomyces tenuis TaxID=58116 RepID=UPI00068429D4|nr:hypothetical protein [Glycomyces tenuis]
MGLATHWPDNRRPVVVELDPEGGDIAGRWQVHPEPGLADVAAAVASTVDAGPEFLSAGLQPIEAAGAVVEVVCAPPGGQVVRQALPLLTAPGSKVLNPAEGVVIADLGNLYAVSPAWQALAAADAVVLVVEGTLAHLAHLRSRLDEAETQARLGSRAALAVAEADYTAAEVEEVFLAADLPLHLLGPSGTAASVTADAGSRRRDRRAHRAWSALAASVADFAAALDRPALTGAATTRTGEAS